MAFAPTNPTLGPQQAWTNALWNTFMADLQAFLRDMTSPALSTTFAAPLVLSRPSQGLAGGSNYVHNFMRLMGTTTVRSPIPADCIRDAAAFGALGDGTTANQQVQIQAAINDISTTGPGGIVILPPGTYLLGAAILIAGSSSTLNNVTLMGCGDSTVLKCANGYVADSAVKFASDGVQADNLTLCNLRIEGNTTGTPVAVNRAVDVNACINALVQNVTINDFHEDGIRVEAAEGTRIVGCRITNVENRGIYFTAVAPDVAQYTLIHGCTIREFETGIDLTGIEGGTVSQNRLVNATSGTSTGIKMRGNGLLSSCTDVTLVGNRISGCFHGISLEAA